MGNYTKGKKMIGRGAFSRVYDNGDDTVTIITRDPAKECYSVFGEAYDILVPQVYQVDFDYFGDKVYMMQKYEKVTSPSTQLNKHSLELYKILRNIAKNYSMVSYNFMYGAFESLIPNKYEAERDVILALLGDMSNYNSQTVAFEISPRNIAADNDGNLILLDCFFFTDELAKVYEKRVA